MWESLGRRLVECLSKIPSHATDWNSTDQMKDFTSTAWTTLEQQGKSAFVLDEVPIAQDLQSADEMRGARDSLIEIAQETGDHLELLLRVVDQIDVYNREMAAWKKVNGSKQWYSMQNYKGLSWENTDRDDLWPDCEYHEYQTIQAGLNSEQGTSDWEFPIVTRLVPQFWAHAQVLSKSWHTFP